MTSRVISEAGGDRQSGIPGFPDSRIPGFPDSRLARNLGNWPFLAGTLRVAPYYEIRTP